MTTVAVFDISLSDYLENLSVEIVKNYQGVPVIHEFDAEEVLKPYEYTLEVWVEYQVDGIDIGAPRPRRPRT